MSEPQPPPPEVFDTESPILHPDVFPEALNLLKNFLTDTTIPWTSNGTKNGVDLDFYQPDPPLPAPVCRGTGLLPAGLTAEQILPIILHGDCRKYWDDRYKVGFPTLRFNRKLVRFYAVQKGVGEGWFAIVSPRDFTGYSGHVKEVGDDGVTRYYYLQASAVFDDVPDVAGYVRGDTSLVGWALEEKPGEPVKCTYIVKFDPKGYIPANLIAQIVKETPLCVARVGQVIEERGFVPYVAVHDDFPGQVRQESLSEIVAEAGQTSSEGKFRFTFSWFGAPGTFDINFDEKWVDGAKIEVEEGVEGEDFETTSGKGKVTVTVKEAGDGKKLKLAISKA
ncbi:hypothetical protein DRE_00046 [Drechslerella stenobrocha 248]|uniref:START domain-containing protein n=1 Tax=Drechslerella stenobrocha 248 TaxID=1043628 RepID=W7HX31_9PEZI|nr:hypothetical protein DRE_00046 [Drechslerella stenobrocha 248]